MDEKCVHTIFKKDLFMAVLDLGGCLQAFSSCSDPWLLSSCSGQAHCNGFSSFGVWYKWISNSTKLFPNQYFKIKIKLQAWNWPQGLTPAPQEPPPRSRPFVGLAFRCAASLRTGRDVHPRFVWRSWTQKTGGTQLLAADSVSVWLLPCFLEACEHASWPHLVAFWKVWVESFDQRGPQHLLPPPPPNPQATITGWENQSDRPHTSNLFRTMNRGGGRVGTAVLTAAIRITSALPW